MLRHTEAAKTRPLRQFLITRGSCWWANHLLSANSKWPDMDSVEIFFFYLYTFLSVLASAVNKLEKVNLADTFITDEQLIHILQQVNPSPKELVGFMYCKKMHYLQVLLETRLQELHIGGLNQSYTNLSKNGINNQNEQKESELLTRAFNKIKINLWFQPFTLAPVIQL